MCGLLLGAATACCHLLPTGRRQGRAWGLQGGCTRHGAGGCPQPAQGPATLWRGPACGCGSSSWGSSWSRTAPGPGRDGVPRRQWDSLDIAGTRTGGMGLGHAMALSARCHPAPLMASTGTTGFLKRSHSNVEIKLGDTTCGWTRPKQGPGAGMGIAVTPCTEASAVLLGATGGTCTVWASPEAVPPPSLSHQSQWGGCSHHEVTHLGTKQL